MGFFKKIAGKINSLVKKTAGKALGAVRAFVRKTTPTIIGLTAGLSLIPGINLIAAPVLGAASAALALETSAEVVEGLSGKRLTP